MTDYEEMPRITLEFDDGESLECEVECVFTVDAYPGKEYAALCPIDETIDDVYIFGVIRNGEEGELFDIEDDAEFDEACRELDQMIEEASEE